MLYLIKLLLRLALVGHFLPLLPCQKDQECQNFTINSRLIKLYELDDRGKPALFSLNLHCLGSLLKVVSMYAMDFQNTTCIYCFSMCHLNIMLIHGNFLSWAYSELTATDDLHCCCRTCTLNFAYTSTNEKLKLLSLKHLLVCLFCICADLASF